MASEKIARSLDDQRREYAARPFLATPLAGTVAWAVAGIAGVFLPPFPSSLVLFVATGMIAYLAMFISKFTGENFLDRTRPTNAFDALFFYTVAMALLVYGIAIPFYLVDRTSLPLTVGILSGMMWVPFSWTIQHWVGVGHAVVRTALVVTLWYAFPEHRFVAIPFGIVAVYLATICVLVRRRGRAVDA